MKRHLLALVTLAALGSAVWAQEKKEQAGEETTKVSFTTSQIPEDLKAGSVVNLVTITGRTVSANGLVSTNSSIIVPNLEVVAVKQLAKAQDKDQAVEVEFKTTRKQAQTIQKAKTTMVNIVESVPGGKPEMKKVPLPLKLEYVKPGKK